LLNFWKILERVTGIGPVAQPWEGRVLPLYYTRNTKELYQLFWFWQYTSLYDIIFSMQEIISKIEELQKRITLAGDCL
jgi:hypothetical protein